MCLTMLLVIKQSYSHLFFKRRSFLININLMKATKILIVLILAALALTQSTGPVILSVSSLPSTVNHPVFLSLRGGGLIYLKVIGHNPISSENMIYVGTFPCIIPSDGVSDTFVTCQTTDTYSQTDINNLPITMISYGLSYTTSYPNSVYFRGYNTPSLTQLYPNSGFANSVINYYGIHRIAYLGDGQRNMGDVSKLLLGGDLCSRFDIEQANISANNYAYIQCAQSQLQEAGKYNISELVVPGYADHGAYLRRSSLVPGENYQFAALPTVKSVTPNNGNTGGQYLTITGTGFSANLQNNSVSVDGNPCIVTAADKGSLKCTLSPRKSTVNDSLLPTNSTSQANGFSSGTGATYARYSYSSGMNAFVAAVRSKNSTVLGTPQQTGFRAEIKQGNIYGSYYGQTWSGYFTPPVSGIYKFIGTGDDFFNFYLATNYGSTELPATPLISSDGNQYWNDFYINYHPTAENSIQLEQGKSYYFETYHINSYGGGFFKLEVEAPNNDTTLSFQTYQVDQIFLNSTIQPEVVVFSMINGSTGTFNLRLYRTDSSNIPSYDKNVDVAYGCSADTFTQALNTFDLYSPYAISVTQTIYRNSTVIANLTGATNIVYTVSITLIRPASIISQKLIYTQNTFDGTFTQPSGSLTAHSPPISGNFILSIGGVTVDPYGNGSLPYNTNAGDIQTFLRSKVVGFQNVEVTLGYQYSCLYSCSWYIKYRGYNGQVLNVTTNAGGLSGGTSSPSIATNTLRNYSPNIVFSPVDYRFLSTPSNGINVLVNTNGMPSICTGDCQYSFYLYSEITLLSYSGSLLSFALSDNLGSNFTASDITVAVQGSNCVVDTSNPITNLTCQLATNSDTTPALVAGSVTPIVSIKNFGIAGLKSGVNPLSVPLVVSNISTTSGGTNGGYLVSISGHGFPTDKSKISIVICNSTASIKSTNNIMVTFYVPSCPTNDTQVINVKVGLLTDSSLSFSYSAPTNAPTIISLSPTSSNPGSKGTLQINGNNFGSNSSEISLFLSNSSGKVYTLNILTVNNTYISAGLSGGLAGTFTVQVNLPTTGDSIASTPGADTFNYIVSISSISPQRGSITGGTLLTITGQNFNTDSQQTLVFIGSTLNWMCNIESITSTTILCRTPEISDEYTPGAPQDVVVTTRLIIQSQCTGTCTFTYLNNANSPNLTTLTTSSNIINLAGTSFTSNSTCNISLTNTATSLVSVIPSINCTATSAAFTVPSSIISGNYDLRIRSEIGESNPLPLKVKLSLGTSDSGSGSTGGTIVTISGGSGYPINLDNPLFSVFLTDGANKQVPVKVLSCCTNNVLVVLMPPAKDTSYFKINVKGPVNSVSTSFITYAVYTAVIELSSNSTVPAGPNNITLHQTNAYSNPIQAINFISTKDPSYVISASNWTTNGSTTDLTVTLNAGAYTIQVRGATKFYNCTSTIFVSMPINVITTPQSSSFNGGSFTINANYLSPVSDILVNSLRGKIISYDGAHATYQLPPLLTTLTQSTYGLANVAQLDLSAATFFSDTNSITSNVSSSFDGSVSSYYGSSNTECFIGVDFRQGLTASISRVRFFSNLDWVNTASMILYSKFQGSNDMTTWTTFGTVDQTVHSGWSVIVSSVTTSFRYIRFLHNSTSQCNIAEIQLFGIVYSNTAIANLTSQLSNIVYEDGFNTVPFTNAVNYTSVSTAVVNTIDPQYGDVFGGYTVSFIGENLNSDTAVITIDGISCTNVTQVNSTLITCIAGARPKIPNVNSLQVTIGSSAAILRDTFHYVLRWSDKRTWGVDLPPIDGDLVYVPQGMTLLIDQDTPILEGIAVNNGTLIFSDEKDITVQAHFITVDGGQFIAGTEQKPHLKILNFIMHGGFYDSQQPMFGNKGIGCMECKFSMYGKPRTPTWTTIASTIYPSNTTFTVSVDVDWQVGEEIVVASTSFYHWEAERRTITAISNRTITVDTAFKYLHVNVVDTFGSDKLPMIAEVGLLTRNIKMRGEDATSSIKQYGSHLMIAGKSVNGVEAQIAYSEFFHCGQPQILGRYCIHFHMNGDVPTSFVRGNAVHDSFARVVTVHAVYELLVELNVGYRVQGHNFFVEDGIETHNVIRNNLAISSLTVTNMLQTDISVASFWVTNPTNDFYGNHAAGSDFYGIWYEIKPNPDGPSATSDVCPIGNPLGNVHDNVAHSNTRFGLRIFQLYSRQFPCDPIRDDTIANDPWQSNPSIQSVFSNFIIYKNLEDGVLAEQTGNVVFQNFTVGENYRSGFEFYLANFTRQPPSVVDCAVIGKSLSNAASNGTNYTLGMSGLRTPRSGVTSFTNIRFYGFHEGSILFQTCVLCDDPLKYTNLGTEILMKQITLGDVTGSYLNMIGLKRDVIYDLDGSLSYAFDQRSNRTSATIVHGFEHIAVYNPTTCPGASSSTDWDGAVMCDQTVSLRRVGFTNLQKHQNFQQQHLKAAEILNVTTYLGFNISSYLYTEIPSTLPSITMEPKVENPFTWALPYITGRTYSIWWGTGIDFLTLWAFTSPSYNATEPGIIFKFSNVENRELYHVGAIVGGKTYTKDTQILETKNSYLNPNTCENGDYHHDNSNTTLRMFTLCQSGKNRSLNEITSVTGVACQFLCPPAPGTFVLENFLRYWSNVSQWPGLVLPKAGDNVVVDGSWRLVLDIDPPALNNLTVDGNLIADDTRDINITTNFLHIRAGNFTAGSASNPFTHQLTIQINGNKLDAGFTIDPLLTGNNLFVVTGSLNLYGTPPSTTITTLTKSAFAGSSIISVDSSSGWIVGDTIAFGPSFSDYSEYETATISSINLDGTITLSSPLMHTHYGAADITINSGHGTLDTRTRVGHLNRNIQIVAGGSSADWGFTTYIYGYVDTNKVHRVGSAKLFGVQFINGGQLDTTNSPLVFQNLIGGNYSSSVTSSSFINCKAFCINVLSSNNVTLTQNVLYNGWVFGVFIQTIKNFVFTNNLIIGITFRPTIPSGNEVVACFASYNYIDPADNVAVKDNVCQGSSAHGFAVGHIKCNELEVNPIANNTVGSALIGFIFNTNGEKCQAFSYIKAYACQIGQISGTPQLTALIFEHFILADNGRGATLKMGAAEGQTNHTGYFSNSYITALSRPNCLECYGPTATFCSDTEAIQMYVASANGQIMPTKWGPHFDVICKQPVYDVKAFLTNIIFDSYRSTYSGNASVCGNNYVFRPQTASFDEVGGHNLFNCTCTNCDNNSYVKCDAPDPAMLGWFGGCGDLLCTGKQNYLITDWSGTFFGAPGTIIANNSVIGENEHDCHYNSHMNGYMCNRTDFAVLEYQSIAPDFKTRIMWPVNLTAEGSNYTTVTNGWREWQWLGKQPQNKRFGRFVSIVTLRKTYNMTFSAIAPYNLQLQIQKRTPQGNNSNYVIIKLYYPLPNSIKVTVNNAVVKPILLTDYNIANASGLSSALNTSQCGSNIYFYTNSTIEFVLTEASDCIAVISLVDSISLTTHFAIDINTFFSNNSTLTNFINNLCALLKISDTSRVKVVGVYSGSTVVSTVIEAATTSTPTTASNSTTTSDPTDLSNINNLITQSINSGSYNTLMGSIAPVESVTSTPNFLNPTSSSQESSQKAGLIAGVTVGGTILIGVVIFGLMWVIRKRAKVVEGMISEESFPQEIEMEKSHDIFSKNSQIHPEQSNIILRSKDAKSSAFEIKDLDE